ncbi:hypothetical protein BUALT_Bualt12G0130000 [Buddleja alternifolia]|uniref:FAF domain-containing protein n=1 Tax=Buddleja alternifolia TaxID=168488 RepID=A0AAV6X1F1_9LAMI|nr:hypothetical protein BUALT_Bualt12G0130000 [Buddleja alternifolia]
MSAIVCHNIISSFDSLITLTTTTTLRLKLPPPPPTPETSDNHLQAAEVKSNLEFDFPQTIPNKETPEKQSIYTYRSDTKSPPSRLSAQSLEICTENLGSESGSDIAAGSITGGDFSSSPSFDSSNPIEKSKDETKSSRNPNSTSSRRRFDNFPPPLTTMSGSSSLQVRRRRDGGRLIIDTVEAPQPRDSCFQAERSDGRLRLCYLTSSDTEADECGGEVAAAEEIDECESEIESENEEFDGEMNLEMGNENFEWISRCKIHVSPFGRSKLVKDTQPS